MELKFLNFEDKEILEKILEWRNDAVTRENSNNTNIITIDIFNIILNKYKESLINPLIAYDNNIPIGILTFVQNNNKIYIGINIDPEKRKNKYGYKILDYFILNYKNYINKTITIYAEVKKINIPSIKLFSKLFDFSEENNTNIIYLKILKIN